MKEPSDYICERSLASSKSSSRSIFLIAASEKEASRWNRSSKSRLNWVTMSWSYCRPESRPRRIPPGTEKKGWKKKQKNDLRVELNQGKTRNEADYQSYQYKQDRVWNAHFIG